MQLESIFGEACNHILPTHQEKHQHRNQFSSHSTGCLGGGGRRKQRKQRENKEIMGNQVYFLSALGIHHMLIYRLWLCKAAQMLICTTHWYHFQFLSWMYCTLGSSIFILFSVQHLWLKMWYCGEPDTATAHCHFIMLLFALPVANNLKFWAGCFGLFVVPEVFIYPCDL